MINAILTGNAPEVAKLRLELFTPGFPEFDRARNRFDEILQEPVIDAGRLINHVMSFNPVPSLPEELQESLMKGVDSLLDLLCHAAESYYRKNDFEVTPSIKDNMMYVVAKINGVPYEECCQT